MKIGFVGLGIMGSRMAANLQKRGHSLVVFNRTREKADPLVAEGARWADSLAALAPQVEVIFTMLAHPDAVEEAVLGKDGFLSHLGPGQMWVDCSTVNPSFSRKMAAEAQAQAVGFMLPFYFEELRGFSVARSGLFLTAMPLSLALMALVSGSLADRFGSRWLASGGLAVACLVVGLCRYRCGRHLRRTHSGSRDRTRSACSLQKAGHQTDSKPKCDY